MNAPVPYNKKTAPLPTRCPYSFEVMGETTSLPCQTDPKKYPLPDNWEGSGTLTFAMAGARSSGKSLYIAVVVKLLKQLAQSNGFVLKPANATTRNTYLRKFEEPLFKQMGLPEGTSTGENEGAYQNQPLIYSIGSHWRTYENGERKRQLIHVVIRDVAGEDFDELHFPNMKERLQFFRFADQIIFMFDPMRVPEINSLLEGAIPSLPKLDTEETEDTEEAEDTEDTEEKDKRNIENPDTVLENLLKLIPEKDHFNLAMVLAKFDTMQELATVDQGDVVFNANDKVNWQRVMSNYGAGFRREAGEISQPYSLENAMLLHQEVLSLLLCLDARDLLNQLEDRRRECADLAYYCFAVSALGAPPETGSKVSRSGIAPFRCLDPFRFIFAQWGLLNGDSTDPGGL